MVRFVGADRDKKLDYYKNGFYLRYITRVGACSKVDLTIEQIENLKTNISDLDSYQEMLKQLIPDNEATGIWAKDGHMNIEQKKILESKIKNLDKQQIFWDFVISFDQDFANENEIFTANKAYDIVKNNINKFFKSNNLDAEKMEWFFTFHNNTDNPHLHLGLFENQCSFYNKNQNKWQYRKKGALGGTDAIKFKQFSYEMAKWVENNIDYEQIRTQRQEVVDQFKVANWEQARQIYNDLNGQHNELNLAIGHLILELKDNTNFQYHRQKKPIKNKVNNLIKILIKSDQKLEQEYNTFVEQLEQYETNLNQLADTYKLDEVNFINQQLFNQDGLYSRLGNEILKVIKANIKTYQYHLQNIMTRMFNYQNNIIGKHSSFKLKYNTFTSLLYKINKQFQQEKINANKQYHYLQQKIYQQNQNQK